MGFRFEWDARKAASNLRKHGVSFEEASTVFGDPFGLDQRDPAHSPREDRYVPLGQSTRHRLLLVAYAERGSATRLISARLATPQERHQYEEGI